jgi:4-hydroxy-tetrahydrodipicolinate synthase
MFMEHCEWVLAHGCDGLNVLGSTGEATSQSGKARAALMRAVAGSPLQNSPLMVGTGTPALAETIELTRLAASTGFDAALVLPPFYYVTVSEDGLFEYFALLMDAVSDTDLGMYLYNFPQMTGITFSVELIERLLAAYPDRLRGMKDSSGDLPYTDTMAATFAGAFDVFPGSEAPLPDAVVKGYAGCISASVNATAVLAGKVWRSREKVAEGDAERLRALRAAIQSVPIAAAAKYLTALRTGSDAWQRMLPPLTELDREQRAAMQTVAGQLGFTS